MDKETSHIIKQAERMLQQASQKQTCRQKKQIKRLSQLSADRNGSLFLISMTDRLFRSKSSAVIIRQLKQVIGQFGLPRMVTGLERWGLMMIFKSPNQWLRWGASLIQYAVFEQFRAVICSTSRLTHFLKKKRHRSEQATVNFLGETIFGESAALAQLEAYKTVLKNSEVTHISVKLSAIYSQINSLDFDQSVRVISDRLQTLYSIAMQSNPHKTITIDMESFHDLRLTIAVFKQSLSPDQYQSVVGSIALQAYLPDSFHIFESLLQWAVLHHRRLSVRIVKGANLSMERIIAADKGWPLAPFSTKLDVDVQFKRLIQLGCQTQFKSVLTLGVGSHNVFDISYVIELAKRSDVPIRIEMLEGMADRLAQVVSSHIPVLMYCPIAQKETVHTAIAYLVRRVDENMADNHFLPVLCNPDQPDLYENAKTLFLDSLAKSKLPLLCWSHRIQNRLAVASDMSSVSATFMNEPDTDWSLEPNDQWARHIIQVDYKPKVIQAMTPQDIDQAITSLEQDKKWRSVSRNEKKHIFQRLLTVFKSHRTEFMISMMNEVKKPLKEADSELSEAIDFIDYYVRSYEQWMSIESVQWSAIGLVAVISPWNFPVSIPTGCICAALLAGNRVVFKPAPEATQVGYELVQLFWEAGVPRSALAFVPCPDEPGGTYLINHPSLKHVIFTGSTTTAHHVLRSRPTLTMSAETGGKNTIIVTEMADLDQAIDIIIQSAFGFSGQKCSAASLVICDEAVLNRHGFLEQLADAVKSIAVGPATELATTMGPLINEPNPMLSAEISDLEPGQSWLVEPRVDRHDPTLVYPGVKLGIRPDSQFYRTELFGPILGIMSAKNLGEAIDYANGTGYGLTAGICTLDEHEQAVWLALIESGNRYINRTITGAIVGRQPFGGWKQSRLGTGCKAGGVNYLVGLMRPTCLDPNPTLKDRQIGYREWVSQARVPKEEVVVLGQKNTMHYVPVRSLVIRLEGPVSVLDAMSAISAAQICGCHYRVSVSQRHQSLRSIITDVDIETSHEFLKRMSNKPVERVRWIGPPNHRVFTELHELNVAIYTNPIVSHPHIECLNYMNEVSVSHINHRHGIIMDETKHQ